MRRSSIQILTFISVLLIAISLPGCSGVFPSLSPGGTIVEPAVLGNYTSGGSLSTLWYHGSDSRYHYFSHLFKVSTKYRVKREQLELSPSVEFPVGLEKSIHAGPMIGKILREQTGRAPQS